MAMNRITDDRVRLEVRMSRELYDYLVQHSQNAEPRQSTNDFVVASICKGIRKPASFGLIVKDVPGPRRKPSS